MQRFVEHERCVDIEEKVNGMWAVVRCSLQLVTVPVRSFFKTPKISTKKYNRSNKNVAPKIVKERLTTKEYRDKNKLKKYGLTYDQYMVMILKQNNKCSICGELQPLHINGGELNIDHDHKTGKVRGLLCNDCNTGIGMMKDDTVRMKNAIKYLKKKL
jgi:hypothetical protein